MCALASAGASRKAQHPWFGLLSLAAVSAGAAQLAAAAAADGACSASEPACAARAAAGVSMIQRARPTVNRTALQPESLAESALADGEVTIVSYNLYWWNVRQNNRFDALWGRLRGEKPFQLIGFQECDDVRRVLDSSGLEDFDYYQNACPLAWSRTAFEKIGGPGQVWIAQDSWTRYMSWVRLRHIATGTAVMFVNTHGPLNGCGTNVGENWANGIRDNMEAGDVIYMTGDYNCGTGSPAMNVIQGMLPRRVDGGIDQIMSNEGQVLSGGRLNGYPSDHPLIKATFSIPGSTQPVPSPVPSPPAPQPQPVPSPVPSPPAPQPQPTENHYRKVGGVGGWGGWCTCPDGQRYNVGDNGDACASLACEDGTPGQCDKQVDASRRGMKVTCSTAVGQPTPTPAPAENHYRRVGDVGGWGGWCTCPDGQRYNVGDNGDACASLACEGGTPGQCDKQVDASRRGMKVTCAAGSEEPAPDSDCDPFSEWPSVDGGVTCGSCTALVLTAPFSYRCDKYCESFGHVCTAAGEEVNENCEVKSSARCDEEIAGTSDMLCTCKRRS